MKTEYDEVEYPSKPYAQCHCDRLAVMAQLHGLKPAAPRTARVLEIGCGDGLNLIASAIVLPNARFHGIDLSETAIRRGRGMVRELGLTKRVKLEARDLMTFVSGRTRYDYVIAHGFYSWVSNEARDTLMALIRNSLAANGVAFVSYNAYPGAYLRQMVREMAVRSGAPRDWLTHVAPHPGGPPLYRAVVADEAADMLRKPEAALYHDDLSPANQPSYFQDFVAHARAHGLQYVSEATPELGLPAGSDRIEAEQQFDFLTGRRFRQSLLCREELPILPVPDDKALTHCFAGGPIEPGQALPDGSHLYENRLGARISTRDRAEQTLLDSISKAWPGYVPVNEFEPAALRLFSAGMIDVRTVEPPLPRNLSRPLASPLARLQARHGAPLTSLHHIEIQPASDSLLAVLSLADGTRTGAAMVRELRKLYPTETRERLAFAVDQHLEDLHGYGLLVAHSD